MLKNRARVRTIAARRKLRRLFNRTMLIYEGMRSTVISYSALYAALGRVGGARPAYSRRRTVNSSDYTIDCDIAARHVLGADSIEYWFYVIRYANGIEAAEQVMQEQMPQKSFARFLNGLQERVGREFKLRGLDDTRAYFRPAYK